MIRRSQHAICMKSRLKYGESEEVHKKTERKNAPKNPDIKSKKKQSSEEECPDRWFSHQLHDQLCGHVRRLQPCIWPAGWLEPKRNAGAAGQGRSDQKHDCTGEGEQEPEQGITRHSSAVLCPADQSMNACSPHISRRLPSRRFLPLRLSHCDFVAETTNVKADRWYDMMNA